VTLDEGVALIDAKEAKGPVKKKRKAPAKKKATPKKKA
jgi:DNA topoisomerase-1